MIRTKDNDGTYDYINALVESDGISLKYQVTGLDIPGSDFIDDPSAMSWTTSEIRQTIGFFLGLYRNDLDFIQVDFE